MCYTNKNFGVIFGFFSVFWQRFVDFLDLGQLSKLPKISFCTVFRLHFSAIIPDFCRFSCFVTLFLDIFCGVLWLKTSLY